jgi:hypothetical protein
MNRKIIKLLYRSFDGELTPEEKTKLKLALQNSSTLRAEKTRIEQLRGVLADQQTLSFKPFFADRVMQKIMNLTDSKSVHELFFESLYSLFRPVVIAVTILLFVLISYNLSKSDQITLNQALAQPEVSLEQLLNPIEFLIED